MSSSPHALRVLFVGADEKLRTSLAAQRNGFDAVFVATAMEAHQALSREVFHGYSLQYWLPDWNGPQLCRHIRKTDPKVPVLICDAYDDDGPRGRALRAGANGYFPRPVDVRHFMHKLRVLMELAELESKKAAREVTAIIESEIGRVGARSGAAIADAGRVVEKSAKSKALLRYLNGGGSLAHFEKTWRARFPPAWESFIGGASDDAGRPLARPG